MIDENAAWKGAFRNGRVGRRLKLPSSRMRNQMVGADLFLVRLAASYTVSYNGIYKAAECLFRYQRPNISVQFADFSILGYPLDSNTQSADRSRMVKVSPESPGHGLTDPVSIKGRRECRSYQG